MESFLRLSLSQSIYVSSSLTMQPGTQCLTFSPLGLLSTLKLILNAHFQVFFYPDTTNKNAVKGQGHSHPKTNILRNPLRIRLESLWAILDVAV